MRRGGSGFGRTLGLGLRRGAGFPDGLRARVGAGLALSLTSSLSVCLGLGVGLGLAACTLDTADVVVAADLEIVITGIPSPTTTIAATVADASGASHERRAAPNGTSLEMYVAGLAKGVATVSVRALDAAATPLVCRPAAIDVGEDRVRLPIDLVQPTAAIESLNDCPDCCNDRLDNDCDGLVDCDDDDCRGAVRVCNVGACQGSQVCQVTGWSNCNGANPTPEKNKCDDGVDNDCDGDTDCEDIDCHC